MKKIFTFLIIFLCIGALTFISSQIIVAEENHIPQIQNYIQNFYTDETKDRTLGSNGEKIMAQKLSQYLTENNFSFFNNLMSYEQPFEIDGKMTSNIIGVHNVGAEKFVIIGAHYDSAYIENKSFGFNDNLSGVITAMQTYDLLKNNLSNVNMILAFWGAEEVGLVGSNYFVEHLPVDLKNNTALYINFDTVGVGDYHYYYTSDFNTQYGKSIDNALRNANMKKYANEIYGTKTFDDFNYTSLALQADNSSFLKAGINSLMFFTGNLETTNGFGYFETQGHKKIIHSEDSEETILRDFESEHYEKNIDFFASITTNYILSTNFNSGDYETNQIPVWVYNQTVLKVCGLALVALGFAIYFVIYKFKNKKTNLSKK